MHRAAGRRPPLRCGEQGGAQGSAETGGPAACGQKRSRQCEKGTERAARGGRMAGTCCPRSACVQAQVALGQVRLLSWTKTRPTQLPAPESRCWRGARGRGARRAPRFALARSEPGVWPRQRGPARPVPGGHLGGRCVWEGALSVTSLGGLGATAVKELRWQVSMWGELGREGQRG